MKILLLNTINFRGDYNSLDPYQFEVEIAELYQKCGYKAVVTKGSGGIDIELFKNQRKGIVQCKKFKSKVGPAPIRDIYGTMMSGKYDFALVVCPSGFSDNAYSFAKNKKIKLIGLDEILKMVNA